jgi:thioredoxin 1
MPGANHKALCIRYPSMNLYPSSVDNLKLLLAELPACLVTVGRETCGICHAVAPKLEALAAEQFPRMQLLHVDADKLPAAAAMLNTFSVPTVIVFFDGKETARFSRAFGMNEVADAIDRPYHLRFGAV